MEKLCQKCKQIKPITEFGKDKSRPDGVFSYCKRCRLKNPEKYEEWQENTQKGLHHCSDCKQWLTADNFSPNPTNKNNLHGQCKICSTARTKKYYHADKERAYQLNKRRYWNNIDKEKEAYKRWYYKNPELQREKAKHWHKENYHKVREKRLEYIREWQRKKGKDWYKKYYNTPEGRATCLLSSQRRRNNIKAVANTLTKTEWLEILESQNYICLCCKQPFTDELRPTIDHIIPVSKKGGLTKDNTQALCKSCNSKKGNKIIDYR